MNRIVKIVLLVTGFIVLVPISVLIILSEVHHEKAHRKAVEFINGEFGGSLAFKDFSISYLRHFPRIHLQVKHVSLVDGQDTIISAGKLDIMLNPIRLFNKELDIRKLILNDGTFFSDIDSNGNMPKILARKERPHREGPFTLNLNSQAIRINNFKIFFGNQVKKNRVYFLLDRARLKLQAEDSLVILRGTAEGRLDSLISNNTLLFAGQPVKIEDVDLGINLRSGEKVLNRGTIVAHTLKLNPRFRMVPYKDGQNIDLHISGDGDFNTFLELFEFHFSTILQQSNPEAELILTYNQTGFVNPFVRPYTEIDFKIINARFEGEKLPYPLENVHVIGNYNNGEGHSPETVRLVIDTLHAEVHESYVDASIKLSNLEDPDIEAHFISSLDISHLIKPNENISIKGIINADLRIDGRISELKALHLEGKQVARGELHVKDLELLINDREFKLELTSGSSLLNNHILEVSSLVGAYNESAFHFQGLFNNLDQLILEEGEKVGGSFVLNFDRLDLRNLFKGTDPSKPRAKSGKPWPLEGVALELDVSGNEIITDFGTVEHFRMKSRLENNSVHVQALHFKYQEGTVDGTGEMKLGRSGILSLNADITSAFRNLDLDFEKAKSDKTLKKSGSFHLPGNTRIRLDLLVEKGNIQKIPVRNLALKAAMNDNEIALENFSVDVFDGHAAVDGRLKLDSTGIGEIVMNGKLAFDQIDLAAMLDDFDQGNRPEDDLKNHSFPDKILIHVDLDVKEIDYKNFTLRNLSTRLHVDNEEVTVSNFHSDLPFGNLALNLKIVDYQNPKMKFMGTADLFIDSLSVEEVLSLKALETKRESSPEQNQPEQTKSQHFKGLPDNIDLVLHLKARSLTYENVAVGDLEMALNYSDKKIDLKNLNLTLAEGKAELHGYLERDQPRSFPGYLYAKVDDLDISALFKAFDNFNQDKFTYSNSSGKISLASHYYFELDRDLSPIRKDNLLITNAIVHHAEFDQVEPIEKTLFFVGHKTKDKMVISQLNVNAFMHGDKLYFRDVLMNDNIANLDVFGEVDLDERMMDLGLEISLTDLFFRSKSKRSLQTREGELNLGEDSKLFLNLTGPLTNHKLKLINEKKFNKYRNNLVEDIRNAEKEFRVQQQNRK